MLMIPRNGWRRIRCLAGLLLAFGLGVAAVPSAARAGCGDYVTYRGQSHAAMPNDGGPASPHHHSADPNSPQRPCSGPNCTRGPIAPPTAPVAPVSAGGEEWGYAVAAAFIVDGSARPYLSHETVARPVFRASGVFHPPRSLRPSFSA